MDAPDEKPTGESVSRRRRGRTAGSPAPGSREASDDDNGTAPRRGRRGARPAGDGAEGPSWGGRREDPVRRRRAGPAARADGDQRARGSHPSSGAAGGRAPRPKLFDQERADEPSAQSQAGDGRPAGAGGPGKGQAERRRQNGRQRGARTPNGKATGTEAREPEAAKAGREAREPDAIAAATEEAATKDPDAKEPAPRGARSGGPAAPGSLLSGSTSRAPAPARRPRRRLPSVLTPASARARRPRTQRRVLRVEPASVARLSCLFFTGLYGVFLVAAVVAWVIALLTGAVHSFEHFVQSLFGYQSFHFAWLQMLLGVVLLGIVLVGLGTLLSVAGALLFNVISALTGGVDVTVTEEP